MYKNQHGIMKILFKNTNALNINNLLLTLLLFIPVKGFSQSNSEIFFDFTRSNTAQIVNAKNAVISPSENGLTIKINKNQEALLTINGEWDLTAWVYVSFTIKNNGTETVRFDPIISGEKENNKWSKALWTIGWIKPEETRVYNSILLPDYSTRKKNYPKMHKDFPNMRGMPDGISFARSFDLKRTKKIQIKFPASPENKDLVLVSIQTNKPSKSKLYLNNSENFFPFIDPYGQYKYADWEGKFTSDTQFKEAIKTEEKDLAAHKGSSEWNEYGGYKNGPTLKVTGQFRTEKLDGKWWIIDPIGNLFWSSGVNSAGQLKVLTPYQGREHFFEHLPLKSDPIYGKFYKKNEYNFGAANLYKKYGEMKPIVYVEKSLRRMKSWGLNTFGGWSFEEVSQIQKEKRVPYTAYVGTQSTILIGKFPDVYHPNWANNVHNAIKRKAGKINKDPYFFGYFVDNEMHWFEPNEMASKVLKSKGTFGKKEYIKLLKKEIKDISIFNTVANTNFYNWSELERNSNKMNLKAFEKLNIQFYENLCHIYFKTIKEAIDKWSPGSLYLGCRWHVGGKHRNKYNVPIGAQYLDIISLNQYDNELVGFKYPGSDTFDKPYIISEFNFGALDSGKFYPGLGYASDQRNRGEKYKNFIESGLRDPNCVGAHWFMWGNSTTAGRSAIGENANCGIVSELDTPYYQLINYMRQINYNLYNYRLSN